MNELRDRVHENPKLRDYVNEENQKLSKFKLNAIHRCRTAAQYDKLKEEFTDRINEIFAYVIKNTSDEDELFEFLLYVGHRREDFPPRSHYEEKERLYNEYLARGLKKIEDEKAAQPESHTLF